MRIDEVKIKNYRQYEDATYKFKDNKEHDLHIILAKNGMGKTNLLNAITWCLYDEEPHLGSTSSGKPKLNTKVIEEARKLGKDKCEIRVLITISDRDNVIKFERKQEIGTNDFFEFKSFFCVTEMPSEGETKVYDDVDNWNKYLNLYMPEDIKEYFFFDGEKLEKYFLNEQSDKIKQAIHVISQVKLLSSMKKRLKFVIDDLNNIAGKKNKDIEYLNTQKNQLREKIKKNKDEIKIIENQIKDADSIIIDCSNYLKGSEGVPELEKQFNESQNNIEDIKNDLKDINSEIKKFVVKYKTLLAFYPLIIEIYNMIITKEESGSFPPTIDKDFLKKMLMTEKCLVCNRSIGENEKEKIEKILESLSMNNAVSHTLYSIKSELENHLEDTKNYKKIRDDLLLKRNKIEEKLHKEEKIFNNLDGKLKQFTNNEKIKEKHELRSDNKKLREDNIGKKAVILNMLDKDEKEINEIEIQIQKAISSNREFDVITKQIGFAQNAIIIVDEIEKELMDETREKIKNKAIEIFKKLEWKQNSFDRIELDENYNLEMYDSDNYSLIGSSSAGERALLALSFTLALQEVAGYESMLFIDTPVGRIDSENRTNFSKVLKEVSRDKQVIITLTTSEYSSEIRNLFEPISSSFIELISEDEKVTTLKEVK